MKVEIPEDQRLEKCHYLVQERQFQALSDAVEYAVAVVVSGLAEAWVYHWSNQMEGGWLPYRRYSREGFDGLVRQLLAARELECRPHQDYEGPCLPPS